MTRSNSKTVAQDGAENEVTIVTYHYVRPLSGSAFPAIKGLDLSLFREQLLYLKAHYTPISMGELLAALHDGAALPARPVLLSFDDGYRDHVDYALPVMDELGFPGAFYPPAVAVEDHQLLDVNRLHFILASGAPLGDLVVAMEEMIEAEDDPELESLEAYRARWTAPSRWDPAEVVYFKRMLQTALPLRLREEIASTLFERYVSSDPSGFAEQLYLSEAQLKGMIDAGQHVGSHGAGHQRLSHLPANEQRSDIVRSLDFLARLGVGGDGFTFCYPYGDHDETTVEILRDLGCKAALTVENGRVRPGRDDPLRLKRMDTNDLPKDRSAPAPGA